MPITTTSEVALSPEILLRLRNVKILESLREDELHCLNGALDLHLPPGDVLLRQGELSRFFWMLLEGAIRVFMPGPDGEEQPVYLMERGQTFGELPLLANIPSAVTLKCEGPCELLQLDETQFWNLMTSCPQVRRAILGNMAQRLAKMQNATFQQEKMASLGTLAAGLMHELNNPGAAAKRATAQLRENFARMHRLTAKWTMMQLTEQQKRCLFDLQDLALTRRPTLTLNSIEQSDAEETLAEWMDANEIEDAWKLAPTFVSIGLDVETLDCTRQSFDGPTFSDALSWLEAMVSSMQLVGTIEESVGRVSELVTAVKSYAYEGRGQFQKVDVNRSIVATLVILGHKLREKQIEIEKHFAPDLPILESNCGGLGQVWTNLLDNAIDAAPQGGHILLQTWAEPAAGQPAGDARRNDLCVLVRDNGAGIPLEAQPHIFDPFYTTKPVGVGTGLGLGIVHRIIEQYGGTVRFTSVPGETEFIVRIPAKPAA